MPTKRRQFIVQSAAAMALGLAPGHAASAPAPVAPRPRAAARACIVLFMHGGPSQIDTWDPKPGRPTGGTFAAIESSVSGIRVSEHLPGLARRMRRLAVVRSLTSKEGNHDRARYLMHTGYPPQGPTKHPSLGALVASRGRSGALPGYVAIGGPGHGPGLLGARHAPLAIPDPRKPVRNLVAKHPRRLRTRLEIWRTMQDRFAARHPGRVVAGHTEMIEQAATLSTSADVEAFDLGRETDATRARYGDDRFGQGCLLARRLVTAGVPFVEVGLRGWDTHDDNFTKVASLSGSLDRAMSALLDDLGSSGLLDETLVLWIGDFGRTPDINARGGRDHYPRCACAVLAGAGVRGGQVIGATDPDGYEIAQRPVTVPDLMRTVAAITGLDADRVRMSPGGRPIATVDGGTTISELTRGLRAQGM